METRTGKRNRNSKPTSSLLFSFCFFFPAKDCDVIAPRTCQFVRVSIVYGAAVPEGKKREVPSFYPAPGAAPFPF